MEKYVYEGKTKDQVLNLALYELNVNEKEIIYNVKEENAGLFKGKKIIIECIKIKDIANYAKELLLEILKGMKIEAKIESTIKEDFIKLNIHSENNSIIIGKKGHILDALQIYIKNAINNETNKFLKITVDVEGYKDKQAYFLERDAKKVAREVLKTKTDIKLDPMKAYERKIIHDILNNYRNIETISEGIEPNRCIVIKYVDKKTE